MTNIPSRTILKVLTLTTLFIGALALAYMARRELTWIGTAFFLAIALNPTVERLTRYMPRRNRGLAIGSVFLVVLAALGFLVVSLVPPLIQQSESLANNLPRYTNDLVNGDGFVSDKIRQYNLVDRVRDSQDQLVTWVQSAGSQAFGILQGLFSSLIALVTILGLTFFMLLEGPRWVAAFWKFFPKRRRDHGQALANQMYAAVTGYVNGSLLTGLIAAAATAIMLMIVGVPYAIPLGIVVGIFGLLPLVGATIGALIVIVVALFTSPLVALVMTIFFFIYQQVENYVLRPIVYGRTVELSALLVLIAVLVGATIGGIVGAVVAIPVFASLQILVKDYAKRHLAKG